MVWLMGATHLLTDIEVAYFRSRIDDVLQSGLPTDWQRGFLVDMRSKIDRYGTRTRLSEKQMSTLKRLTALKSDADLRLVVSNVPERRRYRRRTRYWGLSRSEQKLLIIGAVMVVMMSATVVKHAEDYVGGWFPAVSTTTSEARNFSITDGDTIKMNDGTRVRLVGFNTPEKFEPLCDRERALGVKAGMRLVELVSSGKSTVTKVACSCKPGTEGTDKCNYGRSCGILRVNGRDVGQTLISEGLAVPFVCGAGGCPPTPRPWCG
ncbi:thermonuclease family protein [Rhizobium sp. Pop5]|uniref:thermonuclease family protein n=1 Tax=Rhizobium sp. Pop5 TaxID=1223565 RepID=UPI001969E1FB|nr:thermonuclease family protein [Rhizobium sp. Pop5]UVD56995.1 thermonuclease family protein [Rhizobium sp. Pop5]